jgi:hypothetical protein
MAAGSSDILSANYFPKKWGMITDKIYQIKQVALYHALRRSTEFDAYLLDCPGSGGIG